MTPGHVSQVSESKSKQCQMHHLTSGCRTEPLFLPELFAWPENHQAFKMRQGNPLQPFGLPEASQQQPSFPSVLCRGLGQEPGSAEAAVKSRAACAEASLEMQELEVNGLDTSPAQPPQSYMLSSASAVPLVPLLGRAVLNPYPSSLPGQHSCILRREDAEHPWSRVPMPLPLPA